MFAHKARREQKGEKTKRKTKHSVACRRLVNTSSDNMIKEHIKLFVPILSFIRDIHISFTQICTYECTFKIFEIACSKKKIKLIMQCSFIHIGNWKAEQSKELPCISNLFLNTCDA